MSSIIIAFPVSRAKISHKIRDTLVSAGFEDVTTVTNAAEALQEMSLKSNGILVSCLKLPDMYYRDLLSCLPECFSLLLLDSDYNVSTLREPDVLALALPVTVYDLVNTVSMLDTAADQKLKRAIRQQKKTRSEEERKTIDEAKLLLMERNHMTEEESYRFIQKTSMDSSATMLETAQMILRLADQVGK